MTGAGICLLGVDVGTTTSSCVVAAADLSHNAVSGRQELTGLQEIYRSELVFTPFTDTGLDQPALERYLDAWLTEARLDGDAIFGGGSLITGLAALQPNSAAVVELIRSRLKDGLVAVAGDPCLEAWLAFQASAAALSKKHPQRWFVNLDIGGGTTNIALGRNGDVVRTGSYFVGARHVQFVPGTYRIANVSRYAQAIFDHLGLPHRPGDTLDASDVERLVDFYLELLRAAVAGRRDVFQDSVARLHEQSPFEPPGDAHDPVVTLSGGVGELVYAARREKELPGVTAFGDLGIDLARRLLDSRPWREDFGPFVPECGGRATVYGLLLHTTQVSGSTFYRSDSAVLPIRDVPIFGRATPLSTDREICDMLQLARKSRVGGALHIELAGLGDGSVGRLGERISSALATIAFPPDRPLVLVVKENVGKALGQYVSQWGALPLELVVLDEIELRDARFVQIGRQHDQVVPVSFYGMN